MHSTKSMAQSSAYSILPGDVESKTRTEKESCTDTRLMEVMQGKKIYGLHVIPLWMQPFFTQQKLREKIKEKDKEKWGGAFPGGPVVKNLPSNAGDAGSSPWSGNQDPTCYGATESTCCSQRSLCTPMENPTCHNQELTQPNK